MLRPVSRGWSVRLLPSDRTPPGLEKSQEKGRKGKAKAGRKGKEKEEKEKGFNRKGKGKASGKGERKGAQEQHAATQAPTRLGEDPPKDLSNASKNHKYTT